MLAIVIPYFKINFFEETLSSLAQQTDQRFQVYIGDDASPVSPKELLEKYQGKFNVTYKRFKDNLGSVSLVKQWVRCIDMMQEEEWFLILGDDDVLGENVVEAFYKNLSEIEKTAHVVSLQFNKIDEQSNLIERFIIKDNYINPLKLYSDKLSNKTMTSLSQFFFKKLTYNKNKFIDLPLAWGSDDLAYIQLSDNKHIFIIHENVYVRYSKINISGDKKYFKEKHLAILDFYENLFSLKGEKIKGQIKDVIFNEYFYKLLTFDEKLDKSRFVKFLYFAFKYDLRNIFKYLKPLIVFSVK